jgi:peptide/nickel transport system substrate-binding protein
MTGAGYAKGTDGLWAKGGQKLTFQITTTAGNKRRELTEQIIQQQLKEAGFEVTIANQPASDLIGDALPKGNFQVILIASVLTSLFPSTCENFCISNIPSAQNEFSGSNFWRVNNAEIDRLAQIVDSTLDEDERAEANKKTDELLAEGANVLPLDPLPHILLWSDRVVGPIGHNPIMGPFYNLHLIGIRR